MKYLQIIFLSISCLFTHSSLTGQDSSIGGAEYLIRSGNFQEALNTLNDYIELNPSDARGYISRAIAHGYLGRTEDKERDLKYAKFLNPFAFMYISDSFRSMNYAKKKYEYDFEDLSKEFSKSPVNNSYYEQYLKDIIDIHSQDSLLSQAIYFLSVNDIKKTESILSQIEPTENIRGIIYDIEGLIALKNNKLDEAIMHFTNCIEYMPGFPLAYHNRAIAYKLRGDFEDASNDLEFALSLNEEVSVFYFTLAKLSESLKESEEASDYYKMALDKNPNYLEARTNFSLLQKTLGNYDQAMLNLHNIIDSSGNESKIHFIKGGIHLTYGDYEKAINEFNSYLNINSNDSDAIFNRGLAKLLQGKKSEGCLDIESSVGVELIPEREEIYKAFCPDF